MGKRTGKLLVNKVTKDTVQIETDKQRDSFIKSCRKTVKRLKTELNGDKNKFEIIIHQNL